MHKSEITLRNWSRKYNTNHQHSTNECFNIYTKTSLKGRRSVSEISSDLQLNQFLIYRNWYLPWITRSEIIKENVQRINPFRSGTPAHQELYNHQLLKHHADGTRWWDQLQMHQALTQSWTWCWWSLQSSGADKVFRALIKSSVFRALMLSSVFGRWCWWSLQIQI